jgi:hypothetical protein
MDYELLLLLIGGHYLADFGLQTRHMAETKGKVFVTAAGFHNLTAHAAIHGFIAGLITQSMTAGLFVFITHWIIDFFKASVLLTDKYLHTKGARKDGQRSGLYGLNIDQTLHLLVLILVVIYHGYGL